MVETDSPALKQHLRTLRSEVEAALDRYSCFAEGCPSRLQDAIRYSLLAPGKRLRPALVLMAAEACGSARQAAMPAACAVEMIHAYSLIHDDLPAMDDDDMRRGQPSCHKQFDEATAILAGDALLAMAFQIVAQDTKPLDVAARCGLALSRAAGPCELVGGQVDDLAAEFGQPDAEQLVAIHRRKTGAMFRVSMRLGGLVAQADDEPLARLETYGDRLGLAFQIVDDLLDVDGDASQMGKTLGKDSVQGKLTYPGLLGVDESRRRAKRLIDEARAAVAGFGERAEGLVELARFVIERNN